MHLEKGFTLVEVLVSTAVSAIALLTLLVSYDIVEKQYTKIRDTETMMQSGRNILKILERDIRMAGYVYHNDQGVAEFGSISQPLVFVNKTTCCDEVTIIYDTRTASATTQRLELKYFAKPHSAGGSARTRLYKQVNILKPDPQKKTGNETTMADYIDEIQFHPAGGGATPNRLIEVYLRLRTRREFERAIDFQWQDFYPGDSTASKSGIKYRVQEFSTSVAVRNLTL